MKQLAPALLDWFAQAAREMPWRADKDPYRIWVSEIMLQQTQVNTVRPYFQAFMKRFPTVQSLAEAPQDIVLKHWEGLGYYSRARNLHKGAQYLVTEHQGQMPRSYSAVLKIPGIGPYTAGALLSIAFDLPVPAVDGNVVRVLSRLDAAPYSIESSSKRREIEARAQALIPAQAGDFNQALMELGALICTPKSPQCFRCPVQNECRAYQTERIGEFPVKKKKSRVKAVQLWVALIQNERGESLFCKQGKQGIFREMWCLPWIDKQNCDLQSFMEKLPVQTDSGEHLAEISHTLTHRQLSLSVYRYRLQEESRTLPEPFLWIDPENNANYAIPVAHQKVFRFLAEHPLLSLF